MQRSTWTSYINFLPVGQRWVATTLFEMAKDPDDDEDPELEPGQICASIRQIAERANLSKDTVQKALASLGQKGTIRRERVGNQTLITLLKYSKHDPRAVAGEGQGCLERRTPAEQVSQEKDKSVAGEGQKCLRRRTPYKEEEVRSKKVRTPEPKTDWAPALADYLRSRILVESPDHRLRRNGWEKSPQKKKWALTLDRMVRLDGRADKGEIKSVIDWVTGDQGGRSPDHRFVVQSADALREKYDAIKLAMRRTAPPTAEDEGLRGMHW